MALEGGTVTAINPDRSVVGTGLAKALVESLLLTVPGSGPLDAASARGLIQAGNTFGPPIINYILANAEITVTVTPTTAGLQRTPNPNNPNTPTLAPAADVEIAGSIT